MEHIDYKKITAIPKVEEATLVLDFSAVEVLTPFEVAELFVYIVLFPFDGSVYRIEGEDSATVQFLSQISFFRHLERVKGLDDISFSSLQESAGSMLEVYRNKPSFSANEERITTLLRYVGVDNDKVPLVIAPLSEVIDNAFLHNLGQWDSVVGPLVVLFAQGDPQKKEVRFSVCDLGVGFLATLHRNYPDIATQEEAISCALRPNVTGRESRKGGNGLAFLQEHVFNGFKGGLYIRSVDTLFSVKAKDAEEVPLRQGSGVFFSLLY